MAKIPPTYTQWSPRDPTGAVSLLDQLVRALLDGQPSTDPTKPPTVTAEIPAHCANYLIDAINQIKAGVKAEDALMLKNRQGRESKKYRDALLAIDIANLQREDASLEEAKAVVSEKYFIAFDSAGTANKNGEETAIFVEQLRADHGDEVADEFLIHLKDNLSR